MIQGRHMKSSTISTMTRAPLLVALALVAALAGCQTEPLAPITASAYQPDFPELTCAAYGMSGGRDATLTAYRRKQGAPGYIEFRARMEHLIGSGHMYVVFGRLDASGKPVTHQYIGLFPVGGALGMYSAMAVPIKAHLKPRKEDCDGGTLGAYRVALSEAEYQALVGKVQAALAKPPLWHMFAYNCNHFAASLGRVAGLKPADDFLSPTFQYIHSYIRKNGDASAS